MELPCRDGGELLSPLTLSPLPNGEWDGRIAYLDRDGVLNVGREDYVNSVEDLVVLPYAGKSVGDLRRAGFRICIVTNQSPVNRGLWGHETLNEIHTELRRRLLAEDPDAILDLILYSPYLPWSGAWARKPNPGMLQAGRQLFQAASEGAQLELLYTRDEYSSDVYPENQFSVMVGDRKSDIIAGISHGVRTFYVQQEIGLLQVMERILDYSDSGDAIEKIGD